MEPVKKNIDGVDFIFRPFGVFDAWRALAKLQKTVLPGIAKLMGGDSADIAGAIAELSERLTPEEFDSMCNILFFQYGNVVFTEGGMETQRLTKDNSEVAFKSMTGVLEAGEAVIRLNYSDFFGTVKSLFGGGGVIREA